MMEPLTFLTEKDTKDDNVLVLEHGKPMIFGKNKDKGIKMDAYKPAIVDLNENGNSINDVLVHDEFDESPLRAIFLAHLTDYDGFPTPVGVFRQIKKETYDYGIEEQISGVIKMKGEGDLDKVLFNGNTWEVN